MSRASIVTAGIAGIGAFVAWRYLPARATNDSQVPPDNDGAPTPAVPWYLCGCTYGYALKCGCDTTAPGVQQVCSSPLSFNASDNDSHGAGCVAIGRATPQCEQLTAPAVPPAIHTPRNNGGHQEEPRQAGLCTSRPVEAGHHELDGPPA